MLTLFPPPPEKAEPAPARATRRLLYLPLAMLLAAGVLQLFAWRHSAIGHAAPNPWPAQFSAGLPVPPAPGVGSPKSTPAAKGPSRRELEKIRAAKTRTLESYVNSQFGVSLSYPRSYSLVEGPALSEDDNPLLYEAAADRKLLARIELPDNLYPRSDFLAAYLNLSVDPAGTPEGCRGPTGEGRSTMAKINSVAWHRVENSTTTDGTRTAWREYSVYSSALCYRAELGVVTVNDGSIPEVNQERVFARLEAVLRSIELTTPASGVH